MAKAQYRLFFAIELSPETKTHLLNFQQSFVELDARPVPAENFHITLSFLGEIQEKKLESILDNFSPIPMQPFTTSLASLIYWPKPKILAIAVEDQHLQLLRCKRLIEQKLTQIDFFQFDKRKFIPHITLFRNLEKPPNDMTGLDIDISVQGVSLMVSNTSRNGVTYQTIESWPLFDGNIKRQLTSDAQ